MFIQLKGKLDCRSKSILGEEGGNIRTRGHRFLIVDMEISEAAISVEFGYETG